MTIPETRTISWTDEAGCAASAAEIASRPAIRDAFITLHGTLGAGKTSFARHLLRALGVEGPIKSPTYTMVEEYQLKPATQEGDGPAMAWHFDFYRFTDPHEWDDAGFRDLFSQRGLKLAEWPEKAADLLPPDDLSITLVPGEGDFRSVTLEARSARGLELIR